MDKKLFIILIIIVLCSSLPTDAQWTCQNSGVTNELLGISFVDSLNGWIVGSEGLILNTANGGITWDKQESHVTHTLKSVSFCDRFNGVAVGNGGTILKTSDGGKEWLPILHDTASNVCNEKIKCLSTEDIIVLRSKFFGDYYGDYKLWSTRNGGRSWKEITPYPATSVIRNVDFKSPTRGWLIEKEPLISTIRIQRTTNGGDWWDYYATELVAPRVVVFEDTLRGWASDGYRLLKSNDGGDSWNQIGYPMFGIFLADIYMNGAIGYANSYVHMMMSNDSGKTWTDQQALAYSTTDWITGFQFYSKATGWVILNNGAIFHTKNGGVTSLDQYPIARFEGFTLEQNFPNPFNQATTLRYYLHIDCHVKLVIYDMSGREIETIISEDQSAGQHSVIFDASHLASGIYIYQLKTDSYETSRKMILLR